MIMMILEIDKLMPFLACFCYYQFVEDEGDVVFYKNAKGKAARRYVPKDNGSSSVSDSGVEVEGPNKETSL